MTRKLRITQVVHDFHPVVGGIETYAYNIAKGLVDAGHSVSVFTARMPGLPAREVWEGININRFRSIARPFSYPFMIGLAPALTRHRCDILHAHINSPMTVDFTAFAARLTGVPLVITYHADAIIQDIATRARRFRRWLSQVYWLSRHIAAGISKRLIVTSPIYLESSEFLQRYRKKTSVLPAVVDPFFLSPLDDTKAAKERLGYKEDDLLVLFVGRLVPYKGLRILFRAFRSIRKRIPNVHLGIVGSGIDRIPLERLSLELGLSDIIHFHSVLSREKLRNAYSACDIFVLPSWSRSEAFGIVLLEAMARAKPVVSTQVGGIPYVVNDKITGLLVPPYDPKPLADAICMLLSDKQLRIKMGKAGREHVLKNFTRTLITEQLEKIYFNLLS